MRTILAVLVIQMFSLGALAQTAEFGRASGGTIDAITKAPHQTSGSLSLSRSNGGTGYEGSLGGEVVKDRIWFFAAASILPSIQFTKATAQPVDWTNVTATFRESRQPAVPSTFLSLRSTSVLSDRTMLNFSFSRRDTNSVP